MGLPMPSISITSYCRNPKCIFLLQTHLLTSVLISVCFEKFKGQNAIYIFAWFKKCLKVNQKQFTKICKDSGNFE